MKMERAEQTQLTFVSIYPSAWSSFKTSSMIRPSKFATKWLARLQR